MQQINAVAPAFVTMAHSIVWCTAASVDAKGRPRSRVLHPYWEWDGKELTGWIATGPTPPSRPSIICRERGPASSTFAFPAISSE